MRYIITITIFLLSVTAYADNLTIYTELLDRYVKNGLVDYDGLKRNESLLDDYLDSVKTTVPDDLPRNDQLALYINAYNACTMKLILKHYPVKSIKDIGGLFKSPWDIEFCRVGCAPMTLDEIEHEIIRPTFKDNRIHFAVNCASMGCPKLLDEPYRGETIDVQLDMVTKRFLRNGEKNYIEGSRLYASRIFDWYDEDFPNGTLAFFRRYYPDMQGLSMVDKVKNADYDWSLNKAD
ncbi:DUF547 domain-containing protein [Limisalsivibrio acetivorans]|uniref:DUF547 domain-containing protein n=1 Tax=Limisalsivibrio acetivorans TaxID=1304888 RepID=UPI0003B396F1|nr:DUF547 domain-containing protein [Limisalsivibrio acetivorans]